jgi:hypothetical protein
MKHNAEPFSFAVIYTFISPSKLKIKEIVLSKEAGLSQFNIKE